MATALRVWMWAVPIVMIAAGLIFAVIGAADDNWALVAMMAFVALLGVVLMVLHWWVLYRFGKDAQR